MKTKGYLFFVLFFASFLLVAQEKRPLLPQDYALWSTLKYNGFSENGKWLAYQLDYKTADTLFLQDVAAKGQLFFPAGRNSAFSLDGKWFAFVQHDSLKVMRLPEKKVVFTRSAVASYVITATTTYLVYRLKDDAKTLGLLDLRTLKTTELAAVAEYQVSPKGDYLAVVRTQKERSSVNVITLGARLDERMISVHQDAVFSGLQWDDSGVKLGFYEQIVEEKQGVLNHMVHSCVVRKDTLLHRVFNPLTAPSFPEGHYIPKTRLYLSDQANQVYFPVKLVPQVAVAKESSSVVIWHSESQTVPPKASKLVNERATYLSVWFDAENRFLPLENIHRRMAVLTGDHKKVLLFNASESFPDKEYVGDFSDYYLMDLDTGKKEQLLSFQSTMPHMVMVSPTGKYVSYFKDKQWWVYAIATKQHRCLTEGLGVSFEDVSFDRPGLHPPNGPCVWTAADGALLVYDTHDVWTIKPDGSIAKRLTKGYKNNIVFRIHDNERKPSILQNTLGRVSKAYDLNEGVLLKSYDLTTYDEGFVVVKGDSIEELVPPRGSNFQLLKKSNENAPSVFLERSFEIPPRIVSVNSKKKEKVLVASNSQQEQFYWGSSKLLTYTNKEGKVLKGALFYPANYNPAIKYPMVVCVYEKLSKELTTYVPPSAGAMTGFTISNYTNDGYFVLLPDIVYVPNRIAASALDCVESAVYEALRNASIDSQNIALLGHSFGGYETVCILSKSKLFKTGIVGAARTDLVSAYLTLDGHGKSNIPRFEASQFRMSEPFYAEQFVENSPVTMMQHIDAPVLIWAGENDKEVEWANSMKLQIGLWKLGKKSTLLLYKNEEHILLNEANQIDLSTKIHDWLGYYLKGGVEVEWMRSEE